MIVNVQIHHLHAVKMVYLHWYTTFTPKVITGRLMLYDATIIVKEAIGGVWDSVPTIFRKV